MNEKIKTLYEKIKNFFSTSSKLTLSLLGIICFLVLSAIIISIVGLNLNSKNKNKANISSFLSSQEEDFSQFVQVENFINPQSKTFTQNYYFSRDLRQKWNEQELNEWFTVPNEENIKSLSESNDKIINNIIGAAP